MHRPLFLLILGIYLPTLGGGAPAQTLPKGVLERRQAVLEWSQAKDPAKAPHLIEALKDKDPIVRQVALQGLRELEWKPALPQVAALLGNDPAFEVREEAARMVKMYPDPKNLPALLVGASDQVIGVKILCLEALAQYPDADAKNAIVNATKDSFPEVRRTAVYLLSKMNDASVMPTLTKALKDPDAAVRANAAQGIGQFAKLQTPSELNGLLNDPDPQVQASAARTLLIHKDPKGLAPAMALAKSGDRTARLIAMEGLGYWPDPEVKALLGEIAAKDPDPYIKEGAKNALTHIATKEKK